MFEGKIAIPFFKLKKFLIAEINLFILIDFYLLKNMFAKIFSYSFAKFIRSDSLFQRTNLTQMYYFLYSIQIF